MQRETEPGSSEICWADVVIPSFIQKLLCVCRLLNIGEPTPCLLRKFAFLFLVFSRFHDVRHYNPPRKQGTVEKQHGGVFRKNFFFFYSFCFIFSLNSMLNAWCSSGASTETYWTLLACQILELQHYKCCQPSCQDIINISANHGSIHYVPNVAHHINITCF